MTGWFCSSPASRASILHPNTGEQTDGNGFVFLRARYYQPGMGRFTQMDPSRQETNPYFYSAGNPVMLTDPSGLDPCDPKAPDYSIRECLEKRAAEQRAKSNQGARDLWIVLHSPCKDMGALFMGMLVADKFIATNPWVVAAPPAVTTTTEAGTGAAALSSLLAPVAAILAVLQVELWAYESHPDVWANCQTPMSSSIYPGGTGSISTWIVDPEQQTACARAVAKQSGSSGGGSGGSGNEPAIKWKLADPNLVVQMSEKKTPETGPNNGALVNFDEQGKVKQIALYDEKGLVEYQIDRPHNGQMEWHWHEMAQHGQANSGHTGAHPPIGDGTFDGMIGYMNEELGFAERENWWIFSSD